MVSNYLIGLLRQDRTYLKSVYGGLLFECVSLNLLNGLVVAELIHLVRLLLNIRFRGQRWSINHLSLG